MISESRHTADLALAELVDEITRRLCEGERLDAEALAREHPELADRLRDLLPTLELLDELKRESPKASSNGSQTGERPHAGHGALAQDSSDRNTLGDFRLVREIGRGGMGVVYEAEQISLGRRVALKVLPFAAMLDQRQLTRFRNEARAAAALHHTNIVPVYSVGCERGVHFYAMQYIEGESLASVIATMNAKRSDKSQTSRVSSQESGVRNQISDLPAAISHFPLPTHYSTDETAPTAQAALSTLPEFDSPSYFRTVAELGVQAAEALDHAHEQGVIHRDIKPANLLLDAKGRLWITDFGLARLESDVGMTMTGDILGTLRYMSPEQALAKRVVVDHRTDIYSLGITLYELLALRPAFSGEDRQNLLKQIAFEDPPLLRKLNRQIPVELETIVEKSIRKNPTDRYATSAEMAEDLRNFLTSKPIKAKPPTWRERTSKWVHRHPAAIRAAALFLVATTIVSIGSALFVTGAYRREVISANKARAAADSETTQRLRAEENERQAKAVTSFLVNAFRTPGADRDGRKITIAEVLDRAANDLHGKFSDDPKTKIALLQAIAKSYVELGLYYEAIPILETVRDLKRDSPDLDWVDRLEGVEKLANMYGVVGRHQEALEMWQQLLQISIEHLEPNHPAILNAMHNVAMLYGQTGRFEEERQMLDKTLELKTQRLGPDHRDTLKTRYIVAAVKLRSGGPEGVTELEETYAAQRAKWGPEDPATLMMAQHLANAYRDRGRYADAIPILENLSDVANRLKSDSPQALSATNSLINTYIDAGRAIESIPLAQEAMKRCKACLEAHNSITLDSVTNLAHAYQDAGRFDQALPLYEEALANAKAVPGHTNIVVLTGNLGQAYQDAGRIEEALPLLKEAYAMTKAKYGPNRPETLDVLENLAMGLLDAGNLDEALPMLEEVVAKRTTAQGPGDPKTLKSISNLAALCRRKERFDEAIALLQNSLSLQKIKPGPEHPQTLDAMHNLATAYLGAGRLEDGMALFEETLRLRRSTQGHDHYETLKAVIGLAEAYQKAGRHGDAAPLCQEALRIEKVASGQAQLVINQLISDFVENCLVADRPVEAEPLARERLRILEANRPDDWDTSFARMSLGTALLLQKNYAQAEPMLITGYEGMLEHIDKIPAHKKWFVKEAIERLVLLYEGMGRPEKIAQWKAKLAEYDEAGPKSAAPKSAD